jgi:zinc-ribbon domain
LNLRAHRDVEFNWKSLYSKGKACFMYCPNCATQNIDDAKFCRKCGANLSLVPQALSGHLPQAPISRFEEAIRRRREPNMGRAIRRSFMGLAFLMVFAAIFLGRGAPGLISVWLLIPAFILLGKGVGELVSLMATQTRAKQNAMPPAERTGELPPDSFYDPLAPPSVTERTTRHLEAAKREGQHAG